MVPFQKAHPDYEAYASDHFLMAGFPEKAVSGICGLICRETSDLRSTVDLMRSYIPQEPTSNWGDEWLQNDLSNAIYGLRQQALHKLMNAIGALAERLYDTSFPADLEDLLLEHHFGYRLILQGRKAEWIVRDDHMEVVSASVQDAIAEIPGIFEEALKHLGQSAENLKRGDDRSRKDALRDAMSAMESVYKQVSKTNDIKDAATALRDAGIWGPREITKDGLSIWNHLHQVYPDVRHGQQKASDLSEAEGQYWIDRIIVFVKYIARMHEQMTNSPA